MEKAIPVKKAVAKKSILHRKKILKTQTQAERKTLLNPADETQVRKINGHDLSFTNLSKLYWPKEKITKGMMIDYYQSIADYILPYLKDRPQSLKRNPGGIADKGFYHKDAGENAPAFVKSFAVHSESSNKQIDYIICNDKATLAYLNNLGCIELNPWHSTTKKPDRPDYLIIDIDPSEKNTFEQVIETAIAFKKVLDKAGAKCFCKTSGATGLHIFLPMGKKYSYECFNALINELSTQSKIADSRVRGFAGIHYDFWNGTDSFKKDYNAWMKYYKCDCKDTK
jgi:bifunctional non-homologous end joining protein LigD